MRERKLLEMNIYEDSTYIETFCCDECNKELAIRALSELLEWIKELDKSSISTDKPE
jgi:hypothetical protein